MAIGVSIIGALFRDHPYLTLIYIISLIIGILICYFTVRYVLAKYIFSKIKVIYKFINSSKDKDSLNDESVVGFRQLDLVNDEVAEWAAEKEKEITSLKTLAEYRKSFVGNISHELKTPIFTIQGYIHTLLDGGIHDEKINEKYLERAAKGIERLQNIVDDLEIITKLESGQIELDLTHFDIYQLVEEVIEELELLAKKKNISLSVGKKLSSSLMVSGDRQGIYQVLVNLVMNSLKYGKENGATKVEFFEADKNLLVEVSDDGFGIEKKHLKHLFDRFYRADTSRSRQQGGSGLGLSIVKHIIEAHDGKITVRSTPGVGSTFGFTLQKA